MECFMKYLPFLLLTVTFYTQAAPVATPLNPVADLTEEQIQQTERQNQQKQAAQNGEKTSVSMTEEELLQRPDLLKNALDTANAQHNIENIRFCCRCIAGCLPSSRILCWRAIRKGWC